MSKRLGGIIGCKDKTFPWHLFGLFPDGSILVATSKKTALNGDQSRLFVVWLRTPFLPTLLLVIIIIKTK